MLRLSQGLPIPAFYTPSMIDPDFFSSQIDHTPCSPSFRLRHQSENFGKLISSAVHEKQITSVRCGCETPDLAISCYLSELAVLAIALNFSLTIPCTRPTS